MSDPKLDQKRRFFRPTKVCRWRWWKTVNRCCPRRRWPSTEFLQKRFKVKNCVSQRGEGVWAEERDGGKGGQQISGYAWRLLWMPPEWNSVVYFDQLLGAACTQKLVETFFSAVFLTFFVHFKAFSVISRLISLKNVQKWTKKHGFVYSSKLVDIQKLSTPWGGTSNLSIFGWFF